LDDPHEGGAADFFAAGFFVLGLARAERDFFPGAATELPLPEAEFDSVMSGAFFSGSILDFLATIFVFRCLPDRIPRARVLQVDFAKRLREALKIAYRAAMRHFVFRWLITTVAVMVAAAFIGGIRYDSTAALIGAALLLGILNAFVRPVLLILGAPLILLTLGFFILIVNGLMLYWVPGIVSGFHVDNFGSAFWGAIVIGLVSWILSAFFRGSDGRVHLLTHHTQIKRVQGRVTEPETRTQ
jgi:putative membrane protein